MRKFFKRNFLIIVILLIALFFRVYHYQELFQYGHEQDLQAWIVKNIVVDHHFRLIGQETSFRGVFIGPLYYYVLAFFFLVFNMNPLASVIPITAVSIFTTWSVYYVFSKLFEKKAGYIGAFIYAISLPITFLDRWAVPTQPTLLWTIWFFYIIFTFARGNFKVTPILVLLVALIWYIHIAFLPLLLLVPIAIVFSGKSFGKFFREFATKRSLMSIGIAAFLFVPFGLFEFRHGFQQIHSVFFPSHEGESVLYGVFKEKVILENINRVLTNFIIQERSFAFPLIGIVKSFYNFGILRDFNPSANI